MNYRACLLAAALVTAACAQKSPDVRELSAAEAREIARDAYVYGFPLVDHYRIQYAYFVNTQDPEYKGAWNEVHNTARVYTPDDKAIQTPNSDTPYSMLGLDLRAGPIVLGVPAIEQARYYSLQFIDAYTFNFAYAGSRTTGNGAGKLLVAGPGWKGAAPEDVTVIRSETELAFVIYRTQLFGPGDLENVKNVQAGYTAQPLSAYQAAPAPAAAPAIDWLKPLGADPERTDPRFFEVLNFALRFCPTHPSEEALMSRFARLGIGAGGSFKADALAPAILQAVKEGMADAWALESSAYERLEAGEISSGDILGTREHLKNNYVYRMTAAARGIYGNSKEEAVYPPLALDASGQRLDGSHRYTLRLPPGELPPAKAFWSITMYEMPASLLVDNPIDRYLINSPMLPKLKKDADGGYTIYVQNDSPGKSKESNWLPAPKGPFLMAMRIYWPKEEALNGSWQKPQVSRLD